MHRKRILSVLIITTAAGFLAACSSNEKRLAEPGPVVSGVQTEIVHLESAPQLYQAVGAIRSASTAILAAQLAGTVREVRVQAGDRAKRGQLLAVLDDRGPQAQVQGAEAGVNEAIQGGAEVDQALKSATADRQFAEATVYRYKALLAKNSLSRGFNGAEARYQSPVYVMPCLPGNPAAADAMWNPLRVAPGAGASRRSHPLAVYPGRLPWPDPGRVPGSAIPVSYLSGPYWI